ncbi:hypothetical protein N2152v2_005567 [Parachlorella kessleri]
MPPHDQSLRDDALGAVDSVVVAAKSWRDATAASYAAYKQISRACFHGAATIARASLDVAGWPLRSVSKLPMALLSWTYSGSTQLLYAPVYATQSLLHQARRPLAALPSVASAEREALHLAGVAVGVTEAVLHVSKGALTGAEHAAEEAIERTAAAMSLDGEEQRQEDRSLGGKTPSFGYLLNMAAGKPEGTQPEAVPSSFAQELASSGNLPEPLGPPHTPAQQELLQPLLQPSGSPEELAPLLGSTSQVLHPTSSQWIGLEPTSSQWVHLEQPLAAASGQDGGAAGDVWAAGAVEAADAAAVADRAAKGAPVRHSVGGGSMSHLPTIGGVSAYSAAQGSGASGEGSGNAAGYVGLPAGEEGGSRGEGGAGAPPLVELAGEEAAAGAQPGAEGAAGTAGTAPEALVSANKAIDEALVMLSLEPAAAGPAGGAASMAGNPAGDVSDLEALLRRSVSGAGAGAPPAPPGTALAPLSAAVQQLDALVGAGAAGAVMSGQERADLAEVDTAQEIGNPAAAQAVFADFSSNEEAQDGTTLEGAGADPLGSEVQQDVRATDLPPETPRVLAGQGGASAGGFFSEGRVLEEDLDGGGLQGGFPPSSLEAEEAQQGEEQVLESSFGAAYSPHEHDLPSGFANGRPRTEEGAAGAADLQPNQRLARMDELLEGGGEDYYDEGAGAAEEGLEGEDHLEGLPSGFAAHAHTERAPTLDIMNALPRIDAPYRVFSSLDPAPSHFSQPLTPTHAGADDVETLSDFVPSRAESSSLTPDHFIPQHGPGALPPLDDHLPTVEEDFEPATVGEGLRHVSTETVMASLPEIEAPSASLPELVSQEDALPATPTAVAALQSKRLEDLAPTPDPMAALPTDPTAELAAAAVEAAAAAEAAHKQLISTELARVAGEADAAAAVAQQALHRALAAAEAVEAATPDSPQASTASQAAQISIVLADLAISEAEQAAEVERVERAVLTGTGAELAPGAAALGMSQLVGEVSLDSYMVPQAVQQLQAEAQASALGAASPAKADAGDILYSPPSASARAQAAAASVGADSWAGFPTSSSGGAAAAGGPSPAALGTVPDRPASPTPSATTAATFAGVLEEPDSPTAVAPTALSEAAMVEAVEQTLLAAALGSSQNADAAAALGVGAGGVGVAAGDRASSSMLLAAEEGEAGAGQQRQASAADQRVMAQVAATSEGLALDTLAGASGALADNSPAFLGAAGAAAATSPPSFNPSSSAMVAGSGLPTGAQVSITRDKSAGAAGQAELPGLHPTVISPTHSRAGATPFTPVGSPGAAESAGAGSAATGGAAAAAAAPSGQPSDFVGSMLGTAPAPVVASALEDPDVMAAVVPVAGALAEEAQRAKQGQQAIGGELSSEDLPSPSAALAPATPAKPKLAEP